MNRAQRRQNKVVEKDPVYTLTKSQLEKIRETEREKALVESVTDAFSLMMAIPVKVLHDKYGWRRKKRLPAFAEAVADEYAEFAEGKMTAEEYKALVFEECGMLLETDD